MTFRKCGQHGYHKNIEWVDKGNHILHFMEILHIKRINKCHAKSYCFVKQTLKGTGSTLKPGDYHCLLKTDIKNPSLPYTDIEKIDIASISSSFVMNYSIILDSWT